MTPCFDDTQKDFRPTSRSNSVSVSEESPIERLQSVSVMNSLVYEEQVTQSNPVEKILEELVDEVRNEDDTVETMTSPKSVHSTAKMKREGEDLVTIKRQKSYKITKSISRKNLDQNKFKKFKDKFQQEL